MIEVIVKAGDYQVGALEIRRVSGEGQDYDQMNSYVAALRLHNVDKKMKVALFEHRYGDEWPIIVRKALEAIGVEGCPDHGDRQTMERKYDGRPKVFEL